jgi:hypothetical protein
MDFPCLEFHLSGIMQYASFCDWLHSISIMLSKFIIVLAYIIYLLHSCYWKNVFCSIYIYIYIYMTFCLSIHQLRDIELHLKIFWIILLQTTVCVCVSTVIHIPLGKSLWVKILWYTVRIWYKELPDHRVVEPWHCRRVAVPDPAGLSLEQCPNCLTYSLICLVFGGISSLAGKN